MIIDVDKKLFRTLSLREMTDGIVFGNRNERTLFYKSRY